MTPTSRKFGRPQRILALMATVVAVQQADAQKMYWVDAFSDKVQRANLEIPSEETPSSRSDVEDIVAVDLERPFGIAIDGVNGKVYWTDYVQDTISRANLDGTLVEVIVAEGLRIPGGIAVDPDGGRIYWVDAGTDKIQSADLDGANVEDLVTEGLSIPTAIAVDAAGGHLFWSDIGTNKIQRCNLDGSGVTDIIVEGLGTPSSIALDAKAGHLYWSDTRPYSAVDDSHIMRADLDGQNQVVVTSGMIGPIRAGIAIDPAGGKIYWTDTQARKITRANLDGTSREDMLTTGLVAPQGIAVSYDVP